MYAPRKRVIVHCNTAQVTIISRTREIIINALVRNAHIRTMRVAAVLSLRFSIGQLIVPVSVDSKYLQFKTNHIIKKKK